MRAEITGPELVTLCDEAGRAIGVDRKDTVHDADTALHLAFSCYLFRPDGQVLITRRAFGKRTFPGVRTNSCCGHPEPGEAMDDAIRRRVLFELGLDLGERRAELMVPQFRYRAAAADGTVENELCPVYRVVLAPELGSDTLNPDEVDSAWWVPWHEIVADASAASTNADASATDAGGTDAAGGKSPDPLSPWALGQVAALRALGPDPLSWPVASPADLPEAATSSRR